MARLALYCRYLDANAFSGGLPSNVEGLASIKTLNISFNEFSGPLPNTINKWTIMQFMDMSNNQFTGNLPLALAALNAMQSLDLSHNQLSGFIPAQLYGRLEAVKVCDPPSSHCDVASAALRRHVVPVASKLLVTLSS